MGCLSLSLLFGASDALAMRCAGKIISEGDSKFEVLAKCGKPDFIEDVRDEVFLGERSLVEGDIKLSKPSLSAFINGFTILVVTG